MDYPCYQEQFPSHYEMSLDIDKSSPAERLKQQAYQSMNELEGWCSKQKADVLISLVLMMQPKKIVEIGVFGGKSLIPMAYALKENGIGTIYGIDPWSHIESAEGMEGANFDWWYAIDHAKILKELKGKIVKYDLQDHVELIQMTSEQADPISMIDILHIDGNHSEKASLLDVTKWVPYVKKGGVIIFDDVNWGTTKSATDWLDAHCIKFAEFGGMNTWGIWIKP